MIIADSSAWVDYVRATGSREHLALRDRISAGGDGLAATEPVLMEVLAGARDAAAEVLLRRLITSFGWIRLEPLTDFEGAARIYRACRARGVTPRGQIDCLIANVALRTGAEVLTGDRDFARIATVVPLRLA